MAEDQGRYQVRLSTDEMTYLLRLLGVATLLPAAGNPLGRLPADQQELALGVAERGLLARDLVQRNGAGRPRVQTNLLEAVGACAFPQVLLSVFQWADGEPAPLAVYGYVRDATAVLHTQPDPVLHDLRIVASQAALLEQLLDLFAGTETDQPAGAPFNVPSALLADLRTMAVTGAADPVTARLAATGVSAPSAGSFAAALAAQPTIAQFACWQQKSAEVVDRREVTLLQGAGSSWLLTSRPDSPAVTVRPGGRQAVRTLIAEAV